MLSVTSALRLKQLLARPLADEKRAEILEQGLHRQTFPGTQNLVWV